MRAAPVLSLLSLLLVSALGASPSRPSNRQNSLDNQFSRPSSSRKPQAYQTLNSNGNLSSLLSSILSSSSFGSNVVVQLTNSTFNSTEGSSQNTTVSFTNSTTSFTPSSTNATTNCTTSSTNSTSNSTISSTNSTVSSTDSTSNSTTSSTNSTISSTNSTTSSNASSTDSFVEDLLSAHNVYRTLHGVANLTLNSTLNAYALEWAEYLANNTLLEHRSDPVYGENIYWSSADSTAQAVVDAWYSEISDYTDYTTEPDMTSFTFGHFTQVVWKSSEQLGCGAVTASSGAFYVVCNYDPAGNYIGDFVANVLEPSS